jgi:hypothetical protein
MRLNNTRVSFTINKMDFLVDGDRRHLGKYGNSPIGPADGRLARSENINKPWSSLFLLIAVALFEYVPLVLHSETSKLT